MSHPVPSTPTGTEAGTETGKEASKESDAETGVESGTETGADEVSARLREIVAGVADLDPADVPAEASFYDDLFVDSLQKLEIVVRIERGFAVKLTDAEAAGLGTVADAADLLRSRGACAR